MKNAAYKIEDLNLTAEELIVNETIFHNANGYIGIRSNFEEGYPDGYDSIRGAYINGVYDYAEMKQAEKLYGLCEEKQTMVNAADPQGVLLSIGDETFSMFTGEVLESSRMLDMEAGYTQRRIVWRSPGGREAEIVIKRMTSFVRLPLFTIEYSVKALNFSDEIRIASSHNGAVKNYCNPDDPRVAGESFEHLKPVSADIEDGISVLVTNTASSGLTICTAVKNVLSTAAEISWDTQGHSITTHLSARIHEQETVTLTKYAVFADSVRQKDVRKAASDELQRALSQPLAVLYQEQQDYLSEFWKKAYLEIEGDEDLNLAVKYNMYQLLQSAGKDSWSNIAAKGLSGEGYEGHYFWDTEMYIQPFFVLTNPEVSRSLISYRHHTLPEARKNARILGHQQGALYPWRTIMGKECSGYFPSGSAQYHINGDIAYSVVMYYLVTKDIDFIAEKGAEIIFETARLWIDTGNYYKGKFHINAVTGPDEYTCIVNNNYFTNVSSQYNLKWAVKFYQLLTAAGKSKSIRRIKLTEDEVKAFQQAAEQIYLPYDEELGINPQDDSFLQKEKWDFAGTPKENYPLLLHYHPLYIYRYQVLKQADTVLAHFIYEDAQDLGTIRKSFAYYEKITTHDSSLSRCIYSIVAAKLGEAHKAYEYFGESAKLDLFNLHHNTKDGIHTANMGGNYMAIVYGFGGLRLKETGLYFSPLLPERWQSFCFQIRYEDSSIRIEVNKELISFTLAEGKEKEIFVYGNSYLLRETLDVRLEQR